MKTRQAAVRAVLIAVAIMLGAPCCAQEAKTFEIVGKAFLPDGSPAAGAIVEARSITRDTDWRTDATATSGADGKFAMQLVQGDYRFAGTSGTLAYLDQASMISVKSDGTLSGPIEIRLEKGCRVEGSVIDKSTGQPVGGVKITTRDGDHAESSDTGQWTMVLRRRNHAVSAVKEGYTWPITNFTCTGETVQVKVEIKPGGTIKGRVVDEQGKPIAGARVGAGNSGYFRHYGATTDADGRFSLQGQDPDAKATMAASADGYDYLHGEPLIFPAGKREAEIELKLTATKYRTITGRVTRPDGSPAQGVRVSYGAGSNWMDYTSAETDKDGNYTLNKAGIRKNLVVAMGAGFAPVIKSVEAEKDAKIDLQMKPGHSLEGAVEDEDGSPIAGARISASMDAKFEEARDSMYDGIAGAGTDKDGKFRLDSLPEGFVYVDVSAVGYDRIANERLKVDRKDHALVLRKNVPGQICGTVVKDSDGTPITEFNVRLNFSRNGGRSSGMAPGLGEQGVDFQGTDGRFIIKGLKLKDGYAVLVNAPGYMQGTADPVMVKPTSDDTYTDTVIRLRPAGSFGGTIKEAATGAPSEGVVVTCWDTAPYGSNVSFSSDMSNTTLKSVSARTNAEGKFSFETMPFAMGAVMLEKQGFARTLLRQISFSRPLDAALEKGATVTGTLADKNGSIPKSAWLRLEQVDLKLGFRVSQAPDGSFEQSDLPPGEYMLMQYDGNKSSRHVSFELKQGETFHVDWVQHGEVTVQGKVLRNGKPVANADVMANASARGNWVGAANTGPDGTYKLTIRKPGSYSLMCIVGTGSDQTFITKMPNLAAGANRIDYNLPYGSISGKLVDKLSGKPIANASLRLAIRETCKQHRGKASLHWYSADPTWWESTQCKTDGNGLFSVANLKAGEWRISMDGIPTCTVKLAEGEAKKGVVAKVPATGSAVVTVAGAVDPKKRTVVLCVDQYGQVHYPDYKDGVWSPEIRNIPVGKAKAVLWGNDFLPTETMFQVRADETTKVTVKAETGPKIVFQPKWYAGDYTGAVAIGYRITTPDGQPVLSDENGRKWGGLISRGAKSITIKPGTYLIYASAVSGDGSAFGEEPTLPDKPKAIKVTAGKDTIVEVALER